MDGKVASKLWLEITFVVRRRQTEVYFFFVRLPFSLIEGGNLSFLMSFSESIGLHYHSDRPDDLLVLKVFIQCLLYHQVCNTEDKKCMKRGRKGHQHASDQLMRCW